MVILFAVVELDGEILEQRRHPVFAFPQIPESCRLRSFLDDQAVVDELADRRQEAGEVAIAVELNPPEQPAFQPHGADACELPVRRPDIRAHLVGIEVRELQQGGEGGERR